MSFENSLVWVDLKHFDHVRVILFTTCCEVKFLSCCVLMQPESVPKICLLIVFNYQLHHFVFEQKYFSFSVACRKKRSFDF